MLRQRLVSAAILVPLVAAVFLLGEPWIVALVLLLAVVATLEAFALLRAAGHPGNEALALLLVVLLVQLPFDDVPPILVAALPAAVVLLAGVGAFRELDPRAGLNAWVATSFGILYVGMIGCVVWILRAIPPLPSGATLAWLGGGRGWILLLVAGVWAYDSCAYAAGRAFGRRRFLVHISPSKTYAGLVGGLAGATAVSALVLAGLGRSPVEAMLLGPIVGLAAQAGDLAESMLKRAAGAKDSGTLIPGHGGVLDRIDSFLFAAPAVAFYVAATFH